MTERFTIKPPTWRKRPGKPRFTMDSAILQLWMEKRTDPKLPWNWGDWEEPDESIGTAETLEGAKAAAEAHYRARLMECLEPVDE